MGKFKLPSMETTFYIEVKGKETGQTFEGDFTYRKPNLGQKAEIQKMTARLNGDLKSLSFDVIMYHEMVSTLAICLLESPSWWEKSEDSRVLYDMNVIQEIYRQCMEFEGKWLKEVWGSEEAETEKKKDKKTKGKTDVPSKS